MATQTIKIVEGNTAPSVTLTCLRQPGNVIINVTGCTVDLLIYNNGVQTNAGHTGCTLTTPASGVVTYTLHAGDTTPSGTYLCDLQVTYGDGSVEILYDNLKIKARKKLGSTT